MHYWKLDTVVLLDVTIRILSLVFSYSTLGNGSYIIGATTSTDLQRQWMKKGRVGNARK